MEATKVRETTRIQNKEVGDDVSWFRKACETVWQNALSVTLLVHCGRRYKLKDKSEGKSR